MKGGQVESVIQTNITLIYSNISKTKNFKKRSLYEKDFSFTYNDIGIAVWL